MIEVLPDLLAKHRKEVYLLFRRFRSLRNPLLTWSDLTYEFDRFCETEVGKTLRDSKLAPFVRATQEAVVHGPSLFMAVRTRVAKWRYVQVHAEDLMCHEISVSEFLRAKERLVGSDTQEAPWVLEVDLSPFEREFPKLSESRSIGQGVTFLNRHLSARIFSRENGGRERLFDFLRVHQVRGRQLMLNEGIHTLKDLRQALREALQFLEDDVGDGGWETHGPELRRLGFEPGWGRTTEGIRDTMSLLTDILEAPSPDTLEEFLARLPMIFSIAILSPHGFFGQSGVLGKPDTGGQVVYILDQVRALEREMRQSIQKQGLDVEPQIVVLSRLIPESEGTTCNQPIEHIMGTQNARILRVPFRTPEGDVIPHWISRFEIWPYLEQFALESEGVLKAELGGKPDFILGNYSDGNLVASLLAGRMGVTQCNIAHALEKTKYRNSDLKWKEMDDEYHFSCQFTADLISMNTADFIITSSYQEIAGTEESVGQYESHQAFTMPGLYRVTSGIDSFDPKFNIVSPGADPEVFFPFTETDRRMPVVREEIGGLIFGGDAPFARGHLADPEKPILLAMSRLDVIKNMSGLVDWYARNPELRELANLFLVGGFLDPEDSSDRDEREQIEGMHRLFDEHGLEGTARWVEMQTDKHRVGEIYRSVADTRGAFVQPALFEGFGLTVVEAMSSGLPVFATRYGGPLEIVVNGETGFHIDPHHGDEASRRMVEFFQETAENPERWGAMSDTAVARVREKYNWELHARKLLSLSRIYGFWKYITTLEREETRRYLDMFYGLMLRRHSRKMLLT
ncbi:MAG: sucrose synthase [Longimicrobiales bacterium]